MTRRGRGKARPGGSGLVRRLVPVLGEVAAVALVFTVIGGFDPGQGGLGVTPPAPPGSWTTAVSASMADAAAPDAADRVPTWVRLGMVVTLAVPQLATGLWAVFAPANWFEKFPGVDPRLVAAEPPFNAHLATDAGAGFLATGVALAVAVAWAQRRAVQLALLTCLAFTLPHALYHGINPAPGLTGSKDC